MPKYAGNYGRIESALNQLKPNLEAYDEIFPDANSVALLSIAISLKRIADVLSDGTLPTAISNAISSGIYDGMKS